VHSIAFRLTRSIDTVVEWSNYEVELKPLLSLVLEYHFGGKSAADVLSAPSTKFQDLANKNVMFIQAIAGMLKVAFEPDANSYSR
jgi:hypothetical protein